ncbi:hypothetical protein E1287_22560 [Actinomadura sp. KC06]|uniref:hypothetical protein n=1 Tax=Actinomadura sp. KC06 TaxID=2530369 RepID=UPI00104738E7|nr:hypothetical protein [Actinomadura sp. KC06]TDD32473.1 hypothetical protein E1287_22560 [Actinomadura sp. KC06]
MTGPESYMVDAAAFRTALATGLAFAEKSGEIPTLDGVNLRPSDEAGRLVEVAATNRYVLSVETLPVHDETRAKFETLIPTHIAKRLLALIPAGTKRRPIEGAVMVSLDAEHRVAVAYVGAGDGFEATVTFPRPGREKAAFVDYRSILDQLAKTPDDERLSRVHLRPFLLAAVAKTLNARTPRETPVAVDVFARNRPITLATEDGALTVLLMPVRKETDQ